MKTAKQNVFWLALAGFFIISAFRSEASDKKDLLGFWNLSAYRNDTIFLKRIDSFEDYEPGIYFSDSHLIKRMYCGGWCPVPPIHCNYNGTWKQEGDIVELRYQTYSHRYREKWQILKTSDSQVNVISLKFSKRRRGLRKSYGEKSKKRRKCRSRKRRIKKFFGFES